MFTFDPISLLLIIFFSAFIPGTLIALPFFKNVNLNLLEKLFLGFILGMILPAFILFLLSLIGIDFSFMLALGAILIITIIGAVWTYKEKAWEDLKMPKIKEIKEDYWKYVGYALLLIFIFLAFFIRVQSYSPIYQELDPYWYMYGTQQILTEGSVPLTDTTAWYPVYPNPSHRRVPILNYLQASWYSLYTSGGTYNHYLLSVICSFYPPLVAALLVFCAYLFCKKEFGDKWGLVAAGFMTFLPSTIMKMAAGVSEAQPLALFGIFFFLATFVLALKEKQKKLFVLVGLSMALVVLGSVSDIIIFLVFAGFWIFQSILYFIHDEKEELQQFIKQMLIPFAFLLVSIFLIEFYKNNILQFFKDEGTVLSIFAFLLSYLLYQLLTKKTLTKKQRFLVPVLFFIFVIILFFLPITSDILSSMGNRFLSTATFTDPLSRTIQEQAPAGTSFEGHLGMLGAKLGGIGIIFYPISLITNSILQLTDAGFRTIFHLPTLNTSIKDNSFTLVFLFSALVAFFYELYNAIKTKKQTSLFFILVLLIFPISYVGLNKAKYSIYLALVVVIAVVWTFAFICKLFNKYIENKNTKYYLNLFILIIAAFFVLFQFVSFDSNNPTMAQSVLSVSLETRYQDNSEALMEKFERLCDKTGDQNLCNAVLNKNYWNSSINNRYNQQLCLYSIFDEDEILGNKNISRAKQIGASLKCSRIADYWIDSMEWIAENTAKDARFLSWWDYGHWTNFFGKRDCLIGNLQYHPPTIERTAFAFLHGTEQDLIKLMEDTYIDYVFFDSEIILSGNQFGGKYGALNYLGCAYLNETDVNNSPGQSKCEQNNLWEEIYIPLESDLLQICTISFEDNKKGVIGYYGAITRVQNQKGGIELRVQLLSEKYCISQEGMIYYLDKKDDFGNLIINGGILQHEGIILSTKGQQFIKSTVLYAQEDYMFNNKTINNWENRVGNFYDSNLYKAFILDELEGFEKVYDNGNVKIFKLN